MGGPRVMPEFKIAEKHTPAEIRFKRKFGEPTAGVWFRVVFKPDTSDEWMGYFASDEEQFVGNSEPSIEGQREIALFNDNPDVAFIKAGRMGYWVSISRRELLRSFEFRDEQACIPYPDRAAVLLHTDTDVAAIGPEGYVLPPRRLSLEGIRDVVLQPPFVRGFAWTGVAEEGAGRPGKWAPFEINLETGAVVGGMGSGLDFFPGPPRPPMGKQELEALAKAAERSRAALDRSVPAGLKPWIAALGEAYGRDRADALAGLLASLAWSLQGAYAQSGSAVRDLIWSLHGFLKDPRIETPALLKPWMPWLGGEILADPELWRGALHRWLDAANERLTMQGYHRADQRARHAGALIVSPLALLGACHRRDPIRPLSPLAQFAELPLRFFDLLQAESQGALGRNRIAAPGPDGFGGYYALAAEARPPTPEQIAQAAAALAEDSGKFAVDALPEALRPAAALALAEMKSALKSRADSGQWPERWALPSPPCGAAASEHIPEPGESMGAKIRRWLAPNFKR